MADVTTSRTWFIPGASTGFGSILLGAGALQRFRGKLDAWRKKIVAWRPTAVGADFPEGA